MRTDAAEPVPLTGLKDPAASRGGSEWLGSLRVEVHKCPADADAPFHFPERPERYLPAAVIEIDQVQVKMAVERGQTVGTRHGARAVCEKKPIGQRDFAEAGIQ